MPEQSRVIDSPPTASGNPEKSNYVNIFIGVALLIAAFWVFIGSGDVYDESEHLRTATLMFHNGLQPFTDFFEHHTLWLWRVLGLYYVLGGQPDEWIFSIFGRMLVLGGFIATLALLSALRRRLRTLAKQDPIKISDNLPIGWLILAYVVMQHSTLFVIRPESFAIPLTLAAFLVYLPKILEDNSSSLTRTLFAGVLLGCAAAFSPRLIIMPPAFFLLALVSNTGKPIRDPIIIFATTIVVLILSMLPDFTTQFSWAFTYTSTMMKSALPFHRQSPWTIFGDHVQYSSIWLLPVFMHFALSKTANTHRTRLLFVMGVAITLLLLFICGYSSYWFVNPQNYTPVLIMTLLLTTLFIDNLPTIIKGRLLFFTGILMAVVMGLSLPQMTNGTLAEIVRVKEAYAAMIGPEHSAFIERHNQPFDYKLPFWWAGLNTWHPNRRDTAVKALRENGKQWVPAFDMGKDLEEYRPDFISYYWYVGVPYGEQRTKVKALLDRCYISVPVIVRKDGTPVGKIPGFALKPECEVGRKVYTPPSKR